MIEGETAAVSAHCGERQLLPHIKKQLKVSAFVFIIISCTTHCLLRDLDVKDLWGNDED